MFERFQITEESGFITDLRLCGHSDLAKALLTGTMAFNGEWSRGVYGGPNGDELMDGYEFLGVQMIEVPGAVLAKLSRENRDTILEYVERNICRDFGWTELGSGWQIRFVESLSTSETPRGQEASSSMKSSVVNQTPPGVFISYVWESECHKEWVKNLATRLRRDGVAAVLDLWETHPGDQLPHFMEKAIRENSYVVIVCTPRYKAKSDSREGGVGYEGDIMTAEACTSGNQRKFIPVLRHGEWKVAAPSWLAGKNYVDLTNDPYSEQHYGDLLATLHGVRPTAPPVGAPPFSTGRNGPPAVPQTPAPDEPIRIVGVVVDEITKPRNDGTRGSALYQVPFRLSRTPAARWGQLFVKAWRQPPRFTSRHRSDIARMVGDKIILDGTTIEEVEKYHRETLKFCVDAANREFEAEEAKRRKHEEQQRLAAEELDRKVHDVADRLKFD